MSSSPKSTKLLKRFLWLCAACNGTALLVCLFIGMLLYGDPLTPLTGNYNTLLIVLTGTGIAACLFILDRCVSLLETVIYKRTGNFGNRVLPLAITCLVGLASCDQTSTSTRIMSVSQGSINQAATGLKASYRNIETSGIKLVMNEEVLGHADIPIGEKFYIINEGVKGLKNKEGMVSVGCALQIIDEAGKVIMNEPDLFSGNDTFKSEDVEYLRCAVSTGLPMESENYYTVKAKFWDKYGDGFIENVVRIRIIDMP